MKKIMLPLVAVVLAGIHQPLQAQQDSAFLPLPRYRVAKQSVPSFTISGEQLARMPYTDLGQAIGVWTGAALANGDNTVFVVDGTPVNDVNIYSIQDVATVTFLQTSLAQFTGSKQIYQYMVLITTKRNTSGEWKWNAVGATAFVNRQDSAAGAGLYHQYNLSVSNGTEKLNYGASAGYTHDVFPQADLQSGRAQEPLRQNRLRANAWLEGIALKYHRFHLDAAYTTQKYFADNSMPSGYPKDQFYHLSNKDHVLNLKGGITSSLGAGFTNEVLGDYFRLKLNGETYREIPDIWYQAGIAESKLTNWMVGERFSFRRHVRGQYWLASLDARYRHVNYTYGWATATATSNVVWPPNFFLGQSLTGTKNIMITPSVAWGIDKLLDVQAGVLYSALKDQSQRNRLFPFAAVSVDVLHCVNRQSPISLRLYGSFASVSDFAELGWAKLSNLNPQTVLADAGYPDVFGSIGTGTGWFPFYTFLNNTSNKRYQGGARIGLLKNRILLDYMLDKGRTPGAAYLYAPGATSSSWVQTRSPYVRHRIAVSMNTDIGRCNWVAVLSANLVRNNTEYALGNPLITDLKDHFTTAGFANRFTYGKWFGALDLVSVFNKTWAGEKRNTVTLQEAHAGYRFTAGKAAGFELYAFTRTPFNNKAMPLVDIRKYFGIGCKASF